jgi:hypothetical protein
MDADLGDPVEAAQPTFVIAILSKRIFERYSLPVYWFRFILQTSTSTLVLKGHTVARKAGRAEEREVWKGLERNMRQRREGHKGTK